MGWWGYAKRKEFLGEPFLELANHGDDDEKQKKASPISQLYLDSRCEKHPARKPSPDAGKDAAGWPNTIGRKRRRSKISRRSKERKDEEADKEHEEMQEGRREENRLFTSCGVWGQSNT
eukprot:8750096-Pyramimonas_sp.AAC.1